MVFLVEEYGIKNANKESQEQRTEVTTDEFIRRTSEATTNATSETMDESILKKFASLILKLLFICAVAAALIFTLNYLFFDDSDNGYTTGLAKLESQSRLQCHRISAARKFDCFPRGVPDPDACASRGCCWSATTENDREPRCYYPENFNSYKTTNVTETGNGIVATYEMLHKSIYPNDVRSLKMEIIFETETRLHIKIKDNEHDRFEAPYPQIPRLGRYPNDTSLEYEVLVDKDNFGFAVVRKRTGVIVFDTRKVGGFVYSDQFIQLSALTRWEYIYGLGEQRNNFTLDTQWNTIGLFNAGDIPRNNANLYGTHPFYLSVDERGISHGVFLLNSNAMDIILQPTPAITYRTIGGILDFYFFLGPSPAEVVQQYTQIIGNPFLPPYWSLGFHLCRWGHESLNETISVWRRNTEAGIPFDTQWLDIDYMEHYNDFALDSKFTGLEHFSYELHKTGMKLVVIEDCGVASREAPGTYPPYDRGLQKNIFINNSTDLPLEAVVWNKVSGGTVFPDFTNPETTSYWLQLNRELYEKIRYDGLWLDMNEIETFVNGSLQGCGKNALDDPPYVPKISGNRLNTNTICMSGKHYLSRHYNLHNLYGLTESMTTSFCLAMIRQKRPFILSRSTFAGSGQYAAHWTGDVSSTWDDMRQSVTDIMNFNLFGIPLVGADICGYRLDTTRELCQRWSQLGAFYPFSRNHNAIYQIDQDPAVWDAEVIESTKKALRLRYRLLPYLYTLFWQANANGSTVARPLFFEFPDEVNTYSQNEQFLWGPALLIIPVLKQHAVTVTCYIPRGIWYDAHTLQWIRSKGESLTISAPLDTIPVFFRSGYIIPHQEPAVTTEKSRKKPFGLYVTIDANGFAEGTLFWDDGESYSVFDKSQYNLLYFKCSNSTLASFVWQWGYDVPMRLNTIYVMGISNENVNEIRTNNVQHDNFTFVSENKVLKLEMLKLDLSRPFNITWK